MAESRKSRLSHLSRGGVCDCHRDYSAPISGGGWDCRCGGDDCVHWTSFHAASVEASPNCQNCRTGQVESQSDCELQTDCELRTCCEVRADCEFAVFFTR